MKISNLIIIGSILLNLNLHAAFENQIISARAAGIGNSYSTVADSGDALCYNPAAVMNSKKLAITLSYVNLYNLGLIHYGYLGILSPIDDFHGAGIGMKLYGTTSRVTSIDYSEKVFYMSYALKPADFISSGMTFKYLQSVYSSVGGASGWGLDFGTIILFNQYFHASFVLENLVMPEIHWYSGAVDKKERDIRMGMSVKINKFLVLTEVSNILKNGVRLGTGIEYYIIDYIILRAGGFNHYGMKWTMSGGLTLKYENNSFSYSYQCHFSLPGTHYLSLDFKL